MPERTVRLTDALDRFVASRVEGGQYEDASDVMRTALRLLEREEQEYEEKMALLRVAIAEGDASPDAEGDVFGEILASMDHLPAEQGENVA